MKMPLQIKAENKNQLISIIYLAWDEMSKKKKIKWRFSVYRNKKERIKYIYIYIAWSLFAKVDNLLVSFFFIWPKKKRIFMRGFIEAS